MYNEEWYCKYKLQLKEKVVRSTHDRMFAFFEDFVYRNTSDGPFIVDLGCATQEYYNYGCPCKYFGIDKEYIENEYEGYNNPLILIDQRQKIAKIGNYLQENISDYCPFRPNGFVSLFSTELSLGHFEKYEFYKKIFLDNPTIVCGMVAGVIYRGYEGYVYHKEKDFGFIYQSSEKQINYRNDIFEEFRTYIEVPSEMFGTDIIEVWKILRRKQ